MIDGELQRSEETQHFGGSFEPSSLLALMYPRLMLESRTAKRFGSSCILEEPVKRSM